MQDPVTLLLTSSSDQTAELLQPYFRSQIIRIDLDKMHEVSFSLRANEFSYAGSVYEIKSLSAVYWRKPSDPIFDVEHVDQLQEFEFLQRLYAIRSLSTLAKWFGVWHLIDPLHERHFPKPLQLELARPYFRIPDWGVFVGNRTFDHSDIVAKALSSSPVKNGRYLVTTRIADPLELDPNYTWFLQKEVDAGQDATIVFCCGRMWAFALDRAVDNSWVDWRIVTDNHRPGHWKPIEIPVSLQSSVLNYMQLLGVKFARLDFLIGRDYEWWFLEANMNGQFAWLDPENELGILSHIASMAESPTTI